MSCLAYVVVGLRVLQLCRKEGARNLAPIGVTAILVGVLVAPQLRRLELAAESLLDTLIDLDLLLAALPLLEPGVEQIEAAERVAVRDTEQAALDPQVGRDPRRGEHDQQREHLLHGGKLGSHPGGG